MRIPWKRLGRTGAKIVASRVGFDIFSNKIKFKDKEDLANFIAFAVERGIYSAFRKIEEEDKDNA